MNESGTDTTATDETGNYNGTLNNFPTSGMWVAHTPAVDADAAAFISAAAITGTTQQEAIKQLVLDLKGTGSTTNNTDVWSDMYALYPMCPIDGSTATLDGFKYNLLNPLDTDAAFRIDWVNTPTAATTGVTGNGTNQYGDTKFIPSASGVQDNDGITVSAKGTITSRLGQSIGTNNGTSYTQISLEQTTYNYVQNQSPSLPISLGLQTAGVFTGTRTSSTLSTLYKNGSSVGTTAQVSNGLSSYSYYCLGGNFEGSANRMSIVLYDFISIHKGLTDSQVQDLYDAITTYNTALGR